ncbi:hypothetical protein THAOC_27169, partial [Thalassiosira oceanica]
IDHDQDRIIPVHGKAARRMYAIRQGEDPWLHRLELAQDGNVFACFPVTISPSGDMDVEDTIQTAASLQCMCESSILTELAMWKSRLDEAETLVQPEERSEYRASIPDPAKCLIMEYCGFTDFLEPAIEGNELTSSFFLRIRQPALGTKSSNYR